LLQIDVLRGIAVFGILLVNIWGFAWGTISLRYGTLPAQPPVLDQLVIFGVAALAQFKFYPVFAFCSAPALPCRRVPAAPAGQLGAGAGRLPAAPALAAGVRPAARFLHLERRRAHLVCRGRPADPAAGRR
jgi:hypothetical protein